jgi:hypothetical protein
MRHIRSKVCAVCTRKASTVYCRNDDAFLCAECDASAHANPLAARHLRVPASEAEAHKATAAENAAVEHADCVSESADVPAASAAKPAAPVSIVPPAVELPTNQVMDKDALAKAFGKDLEVRFSSPNPCYQCLPLAGTGFGVRDIQLGLPGVCRAGERIAVPLQLGLLWTELGLGTVFWRL